MVTHHRIYTINGGKMESWIRMFNEVVLPLNVKFGAQVIGAWVNHCQNEFIWIRSFPTEDQLKTYETSAERTAQLPEAGLHIAKIEVRTIEDALASI